MSRHNPPYPEMGGNQRQEPEPVEFERKNQEQPHMKWAVVESPEQSFKLEEDDHILDSYFNPEYNAWEVLILLEPAEEDD